MKLCRLSPTGQAPQRARQNPRTRRVSFGSNPPGRRLLETLDASGDEQGEERRPLDGEVWMGSITHVPASQSICTSHPLSGSGLSCACLAPARPAPAWPGHATGTSQRHLCPSSGQVTTMPGEHQAHPRAEPRSLAGCRSWHGRLWHLHMAAVCKSPGGRWHMFIHACQRSPLQMGWRGEPCTPLRCPQTHPSSSFCLPQTRLSIPRPASLCMGMKLWSLAWSSSFTRSHRLDWALCGIFAAA